MTERLTPSLYPLSSHILWGNLIAHEYLTHMTNLKCLSVISRIEIMLNTLFSCNPPGEPYLYLVVGVPELHDVLRVQYKCLQEVPEYINQYCWVLDGIFSIWFLHLKIYHSLMNGLSISSFLCQCLCLSVSSRLPSFLYVSLCPSDSICHSLSHFVPLCPSLSLCPSVSLCLSLSLSVPVSTICLCYNLAPYGAIFAESRCTGPPKESR